MSQSPAPEYPPSAPSDGSLIRRYRAGEDAAATSLYRRYARRLRVLAAKRCRPGFAGRFDADDIVQSVFRTFFDGVRHRTYDAPPGGEIWGLLLVLALNKIRSNVGHHRADKRNVDITTSASDAGRHRPLARDESAAAFLRLVLDEQLTDLPESNRAIVRMRMEGFGVNEIATQTGRALRTVERVIQDFRDRLARA